MGVVRSAEDDLPHDILTNQAGAQAPAIIKRNMSIIDEFVGYLVNNKGLAVGTATEYLKDMREIQTWMVANGIDRFSAVTKEHIDNYVASLAVAGRKPATIRRRISCLRSFYQYAWVKGLTKVNPAKYVSTPKTGESVPKTLGTDAIAATISDTSIDATTRVMVTIMAETGVRVSELRTITMGDISQGERSIMVHGKGNKERKVYYGAGTAAVVGHLHLPGNTHLFAMDDREARSRIFWALRKHTSAAHCSSHCIRHTWATAMLEAGADLKSISTLMGHTSVTTTERYAKAAGVKVAADYNKYHRDYV